MSQRQHKHFNTLLNRRVEASASSSYTGSPIRYAHTREVDSFHPLTSNRKVRVTRNQKTGMVERVVEKTRVADMNIMSPKRCFDWRISVSLENQGLSFPLSSLTRSLTGGILAQQPQDRGDNLRYKDRISYSHQLLQVDLTQVSSSGPGIDPLTHELEIEFRDARVLLHEAAKEARGEPNKYLEMVQIFLNNIRTFSSSSLGIDIDCGVL